MSRIKVLTNIILGLALLVPVGWAYAGDDEIPPPPAVAPLVEPTDTPVPYHYEVPEKLQDGWSVRDLRKEKADFQKINHEMELLVGNPWALMHSLLVFRHGRLILEKYFNGYTAASHQSLFSCTPNQAWTSPAYPHVLMQIIQNNTLILQPATTWMNG